MLIVVDYASGRENLYIALTSSIFVLQMTKLAWDSYELFVWGQNELKPITRKGHSASIFGNTAFGATIVDSLDTLYLMGLKDEFKKGRDWIASSFSFQAV